MRSLEKELGYRFQRPELLREALSHRSYVGARGGDRLVSNERLEFLGDAVLDLIVARELFLRHPHSSEGDLTQMKSLLVSRPLLEKTARRIGLGDALLLSRNEESMGGRERPSILADALEAVLGAVYLDGGLQPVYRFISGSLVNELPELTRMPDMQNYKSRLLEYVQRQKKGRVHYRTAEEEGPDHDKTFTVEALLEKEVLGRGTGESKKQAQQEAARAALEYLGVMGEGKVPSAVDLDDEREEAS